MVVAENSQSSSNTQDMISVASQPKEQPMSLDYDIGGIAPDAYISSSMTARVKKRRRNGELLDPDHWAPEDSSVWIELEKLKIDKLAENDGKRLEIEGKRLDNEGKKLDNEGKQIDLEKLKEVRQTEQIKLEMMKLERMKPRSK